MNIYKSIAYGMATAAAAVALAAAPASAEVVTFEGYGANTILEGSPGTSGSFTFASSFDHFHFGDGLSGVPSNGTGILLQDRNATITMTLTAGGLFDLGSGDFGEDVSFGDPATSILVTGFFGVGGSIAQLVLLDGNSSAFQNVALGGFVGLSSVTFKGLGGSGGENSNGFTLDNLNTTAAVPEPASWAMMIGGLGLVGAAMRRRKVALRFA